MSVMSVNLWVNSECESVSMTVSQSMISQWV